MRAFMVAVAMSASLAASAGAGPIAVEFEGVVHSVAPLVASQVAPQLAIGDPFSGLLTLGTSPGSPAEMSFGIGSIQGSALCSGCAGAMTTLPAGTLNFMPGSVLGPPTQWASNGWFVQSLFSLTLNQGWQSGSMFIWLENAFIGGGVNGRITSMRVVAQSVPEPSTLALITVGLGTTLAVRLRRSRRRPADTPV